MHVTLFTVNCSRCRWVVPPFLLVILSELWGKKKMSSSADVEGGSGSQQQHLTHWTMYELQPFFTLQPVPATLKRQLALWCALIVEFTAAAVERDISVGLDGDCGKREDTVKNEELCPLARVVRYDSDLFVNPRLRRRLSPDAARAVLAELTVLYPASCTVVSASYTAVAEEGQDGCGVDAVLVCPLDGGVPALESNLIQWVLEESAGTTMADLLSKSSTSGSVHTFLELAEARAIYPKQLRGHPLSGTSSAAGSGSSMWSQVQLRNKPCCSSPSGATTTTTGTTTTTATVGGPPGGAQEGRGGQEVAVLAQLLGRCRSAGRVSEEEAVRGLLTAHCNSKSSSAISVSASSSSVLAPLQVTMFNLDGTDTEPFEGVKIGGGGG